MDAQLSVTRCRVLTVRSFIRNYKNLPEHRVHGHLIARRIITLSDHGQLPGGGPHTLLFAGFNTCPAGHTSSCHWHRFEELWYVASGFGWWCEHGGERRPLRAGDVVYVNLDGPHEVCAEEDLDVFCLGVRVHTEPWPDFWSSYFEPAEKVTQIPAETGRPDMRELLGATLRLVETSPSAILPVQVAPSGTYDRGVTERVVMGTGTSGARGWTGTREVLHYTYNLMPRGSTVLYHWHYYEEVLFVVRGSGEYRDADGTVRELREGDTVYVAPNSPHGLSATEDSIELISVGLRVPGGRPDLETRFVPFGT